jgi:hypothetical protein
MVPTKKVLRDFLMFRPLENEPEGVSVRYYQYVYRQIYLREIHTYACRRTLGLDKILNAPTGMVNTHFLRKERLYTKLKYSRSPAYDIVSGGAAALLAGFLGFLVSEKYGFELVDSGDFYYLFMYLVFLSFSVRPLLTSLDAETNFTASAL